MEKLSKRILYSAIFSIIGISSFCFFKGYEIILQSRLFHIGSSSQQKEKIISCFTQDRILFFSEHSKEITELYSLKYPIAFEELKGGVRNLPIAIYTINKDGSKTVLGILKKVNEASQSASKKLEMLALLKLQGFPHFPSIFTDKQGHYLARVGDEFYSFMEYLSPDSRIISFEEMLEITGKLHSILKPIALPSICQQTKLDEYRSNRFVFLDPWFDLHSPEITRHHIWPVIIELSHFFATDEFQNLYHSLPMQMIHGDNNQSNIVISKNIPYFVDFDTLGYDVRLIDIMSYLRWGGFEKYKNSMTNMKQLFKTINSLYGRYAGNLSSEEEEAFDIMLIFSQMWFLSYALDVIKTSALDNNSIKVKEFTEYCLYYLRQINIMYVAQHKKEEPILSGLVESKILKKKTM